MDPLTLISVLGSIASIVALFQNRGEAVTAKAVEDYVVAEFEKGQKHVSKEDIEEISELTRVYIRITRTEEKIRDRIDKKCLKPLEDTIEDHSNDNDDVVRAREKARFCVCQLLRLVEMDNDGDLPDPDLRYLNKRFKCSMLKY